MADSILRKWSFVCTNRARINILFYYKPINRITETTAETHKHMKSLLIKTLIITSGMVIVVRFLSHVWLCDPRDCSVPGFHVLHYLPEFAQIDVHWVGDEIQPSHPLSSPSPLACNLSQHQGLFQRVSSSHQVAKVLEFQLQHQSFQWTPRTDLLQDGLVGSPCSPRDSQESSPTPQFESINSSASDFFMVQWLLLDSKLFSWYIYSFLLFL